jgi:K+-transporting ATPase ATPase C chain
MKQILTQLRISVIATIALAVIVCGIYPLVVWGLAQTLFHHQANGSLIKRDGSATDNDAEAVCSSLIGQSFSDAKYFHPRPSAAGNGYDPTASGGSNLGPTSVKLIEALKQRCADYARENHLAPGTPIPPDAVTGSASGVDPHVSLANAQLQAQRVADARNLPLDRVKLFIAQCTEGPDLGILGDPGVNVVKLNLALDNQQK